MPSGAAPAHAQLTGDAVSFNNNPSGARLRRQRRAGLFVMSYAALFGAADGPHPEAGFVTPQNAFGQARPEVEQGALAALDTTAMERLYAFCPMGCTAGGIVVQWNSGVAQL